MEQHKQRLKVDSDAIVFAWRQVRSTIVDQIQQFSVALRDREDGEGRSLFPPASQKSRLRGEL